jgi:hypothetical protein
LRRLSRSDVLVQLTRSQLARLRAASRGAAVAGARLARAAFARVWPPGPRHAAAVLAAGVVALGAYGLAFYATLRGRLPTDLDWRSVAVLLARDARAGDAVAIAPPWAERARQVLPPDVPLLAFPSFAGEDLLGVRRVWLVGLPDAPGYRSRVEDELTRRASGLSGPQHLGALELTRYDLSAPRLPLAYLPDRLSGAAVSVGDRTCQPDARGVFRCPAPPYVVVAREVREIAFLPRPCIFAHPSPDARAPLSITFPAVTMGNVLRGHTGIVGEAAYDGETPVRLSVTIDGQPAGEASEPPASPGWHEFQLDTSRHAGRVRAVTFTVTAADVTRRHFCFDAYTQP